MLVRSFAEARKGQQPAVRQLSTQEVLLQLTQQQTQLLTVQQEQLSQLRADVDQIMQTGRRPVPVSPRPVVNRQLSLPGIQAVSRSRQTSSLRQSISQHVTDYCAFHGAKPREAYHYLYKRLYEVHSINVHRLQRTAGESMLDALERYGYLDRLYSLVRQELNYPESL